MGINKCSNNRMVMAHNSVTVSNSNNMDKVTVKLLRTLVPPKLSSTLKADPFSSSNIKHPSKYMVLRLQLLELQNGRQLLHLMVKSITTTKGQARQLGRNLQECHKGRRCVPVIAVYNPCLIPCLMLCANLHSLECDAFIDCSVYFLHCSMLSVGFSFID